MRLNARIEGQNQPGPPLLIAHGLLGQMRNFASLARKLAQTRPVVTIDMRNHGDSPRAPAMDYAALGQDLADTLEADKADILGHSMGGKAAMALALQAPDRVRRLIVADIAPIRYAHDHEELIAALRGLDLARISRRSEADAALAGEIAEPMLRAFLLQNLAFEDATPRWKPDLAALQDALPDLLDFPDALRARRFDGPALFLRGGASPYVPPSAEEPIRALFPAARIETIPDAAHWLHADKPEAFLREVAGFLA